MRSVSKPDTQSEGRASKRVSIFDFMISAFIVCGIATGALMTLTWCFFLIWWGVQAFHPL
jgi:hypothetical protein